MKQIDPVIKKSKSSFSILLLRDDSKVVSFRLTPFWIKFLLLFFAVFSGLSGAAGYTAHYYWKKYNNLQRERSEMAEILGENRRQLGRFAGIEKIKESTLPRSTMVGITAVAPGNGAQADPPSAPQAAAPSTTPPASPGTPPAATLAQQPATQPPGNGQKPAAPTDETEFPFGFAEQPARNGAPQPEQRAETASPAPPQPVPEDPAPDALNGVSPERTVTASGPGSTQAISNEHPALVDEVQIRHSGGNRFRLVFDLSNRNQQMTLNGRVRLAVATKTGSRHDITDVNRDTLRFVINRFKKVTTAFSLPGDMETADAATLYVTVTAEDVPDVTYRFSFPDL